MAFELLTFDQALARLPGDKTPKILLGNGFSRACLEAQVSHSR
ncbi:MAG TPA: hypothetical protein VJO34_04330 [Methylomirabilota bacterium]|nr:hypothetical protein [Methylomirabilota bacterium]